MGYNQCMDRFIPWKPDKMFYVKEDGTHITTTLDKATFSNVNVIHLHLKLRCMMHSSRIENASQVKLLKGPTNEEN